MAKKTIDKRNLHIVKNFFETHTNYALSNIATSAYIFFTVFKEDPVVESLCRHYNVKYDILLEALYDVAQGSVNCRVCYKSRIKRSPSELQKYPIAWMYYSFYFQFKLSIKNMNSSVDKNFTQNEKNLFKLPLNYQYKTIEYREKEKISFSKIKEREISFYQDTALLYTRISDILIYFVKSNDQTLIEKYILNESTDIYENFFRVFETIDKNLYSIEHGEKLNKNHILYKNTDGGDTVIDVSRILTKGEIGDIQKYMLEGKENHNKLVNYIFQQRIIREGKRKTTSQHQKKINSTEQEILLEDAKKVKLKKQDLIEDNLELEEKQTIIIRNTSIVLGEVSNKRAQQRKNRGFSATITKNRLLLPNHYTLPPLSQIQLFLHKVVFKKKYEQHFNEENFYTLLFLLLIVLGIEYKSILDIFFENDKKNKYPSVRYEDGKLIVKFAKDNIFSKSPRNSNFYLNTRKSIEYTLPHTLSMLIMDMRRKIDRLDKEKIEETFAYFKNTLNFRKILKKWIREFPCKVNLNFNELWRIQATHRLLDNNEDLTSMLSTGLYQDNSKSSLAYATVNHKTKEYTEWITKLYKNIGGEVCVHTALDISFAEPTSKTIVKYVPAGSNRVLNVDAGKKFFLVLYNLIRMELNGEKRFNLFSIYLRYAMSILIGTRGGIGSDSFQDISFELKVLNLSEKSQSLLSGVRIVPLGETIIGLIKKYKKEGEFLGVTDIDKPILLKKDTRSLCTNKSMKSILVEYLCDDFLVSFVGTVPLNTGRHAITYFGTKKGINSNYLKAMKGHYFQGSEQFGIYSTMNIQEYICEIRKLTEMMAGLYEIKQI